MPLTFAGQEWFSSTDGIHALLGELTQTLGEKLVYAGFPPHEGIPETPTCGVSHFPTEPVSSFVPVPFPPATA
ncbi:hypothetical protein IMZ48_28340 [Candidatus Bathyarchaeota archaeon]|nr:hypothetical protein [Candidatus Bathyarchaeota archaeon]